MTTPDIVKNSLSRARELAGKFSLDPNMCNNAIEYIRSIDDGEIKVLFSELKNNIKKHSIHERTLMLGNLEEINNLYNINEQIIRDLSRCSLNSNGRKLKNILIKHQELILYIINSEQNNEDYNDTIKLEVTSNYYHYMLYLFYFVIVVIILLYCLFYKEHIYFVDTFIFIVGTIIFIHFLVSFIKNNLKIKIYY